MDKSICFALYGSKPMYCEGLSRNIEIAKEIYPDWTVEVFYDSSVPKIYIDQYKNYPNTQTYDMSGFPYPGMFWRFLSKSSIWISRDCDSRLSMREKLCVDEWLNSGKALHILRDHPAHISLLNIDIHILGGMFGLNKNIGMNPNLEATILLWSKNNNNSWAYGQDQIFLKNLYLFYKAQDQIFCHDSLSNIDGGIPYPTGLAPEYHFVGEVFNEKNERREDHYNDWLRFASQERMRK